MRVCFGFVNESDMLSRVVNFLLPEGAASVTKHRLLAVVLKTN
jgi:hypothetical protein